VREGDREQEGQEGEEGGQGEGRGGEGNGRRRGMEGEISPLGHF